MSDKSSVIAEMNDQLRSTFHGGRVVMSRAFACLPELTRISASKAIREFKDFNKDNDPHGEHDCAILDLPGVRVMFKIDYYDQDYKYLSPDPTDPKLTRRVMTIMLASDY